MKRMCSHEWGVGRQEAGGRMWSRMQEAGGRSRRQEEGAGGHASTKGLVIPLDFISLAPGMRCLAAITPTWSSQEEAGQRGAHGEV